ncbi:S41 family peptidase [Pseudoduganella sp. OTU4001]|uniref:S41 family peptidase n=1 Tax=Pseudoduganella sp. OTU4001 TaxID=3043854 RepID=UPI00313E2815
MKIHHLLFALGVWYAAPLHAGTASFSPAQLQQDLQFLRQAIENTHPDPALRSGRAVYEQAFKAAQARLQQPLSRDEAWRALAAMNPVFSDAHMGVVFPDWRSETRAYLAAGGRLFPFEVAIDGLGRLVITAALGGGASALAGRQVDSINGVPAARVLAELGALVHGDTPAFRNKILERRLWLYYWKRYGAVGQFTLGIGGKSLSMPAASATPAVMARDTSFEQTFQFRLLPGGVGLLTVNDFSWPDKKLFYAFTERAFTTLREAGAQTLLIDVRENTGGDDDMWKTGILRYIADKPYRNGSSYIKKVIAGRAGPGEKVGDVVTGQVDSWVQPEPAHPLHFNGKVFVLVGDMTYSSAILFSNTVQDHGFAKLVGAGGYAYVRQTGGIQKQHLLPHTGLEVVVPRFVLDRPSGKREPALVQPDIVLADDPFDRQALVNALLKHPAATGN